MGVEHGGREGLIWPKNTVPGYIGVILVLRNFPNN